MSKIKLMTTKQLRQKNNRELHKLLKEEQVKKEQNQMNLVNKRTKDTNSVFKNRLLIARIKTVMAEKRALAKLEVAKEKKAN